MLKQPTDHVYIALIHYPVYDRTGRTVATSVANLDIHDLARCARTYGVRRFYIATPLPEQRELVGKILDHWRVGYGATFNPSRREAFERTQVIGDLDEAVRDITAEIAGTGRVLNLVATGATLREGVIGYPALQARIGEDREAYLILFGTGSGLAQEIVEQCRYRLAPIVGPGDYNHLSVRSAAAVVLDRLFGDRLFGDGPCGNRGG